MNGLNNRKIVDDLFMVPWSDGNGQLRREIWVNGEGRVDRYCIAYLNLDILTEDGGNALGYELANGELSLHRMGSATPCAFSGLGEIEERFAIEWELLPKQSEPVANTQAASDAGPGHDDYSETKDMKLTIAKGSAADFFARGKEIARRLDRGESVEPEKVVIFGDRHDLCYSQMPKR